MYSQCRFPEEFETGIDVENKLLKYNETEIRNKNLGIEGVEILIPFSATIHRLHLS